MTQILAIKGTYRHDGMIDQAIAVAADAARRGGADVDVIDLREMPIGFCTNCRQCMQAPGDAPGECVQHDAMEDLVRRIEAADRYILASPTNFYSVTALFKRFMERLAVYAYWPWGANAPRMRKAKRPKKALLIASSAAPAVLARLFFATLSQLRATARTIGADSRAVFIGLASHDAHPRLKPAHARRIERAVARLL